MRWNFTALVAVVGLALTGCGEGRGGAGTGAASPAGAGEKEATVPVAPPELTPSSALVAGSAQEEAGAPAAPPAPAHGAAEGGHGPVTLTPELAAGSVRLTVTVGGAIHREYGAVILPPGQFSPAVRAQAPGRLALAWVPDYDETALRDKACKLTVHRNLSLDGGAPRFLNRVGTLAGYDAATRMVVVAFNENFAYSQDGHLRIGSATSGPMHALLPLHEGEPQELAPARLVGGRLVCERLAQVRPPLPRTIAVLGAGGSLAGFAREGEDGAGWLYQAATVPGVDTRGVRLLPLSLEARYQLGDALPLALRAELFDLFKEAQRYRVAYRTTSAGARSAAGGATAGGGADQPALEGATEVPSSLSQFDRAVQFSVPKPDPALGDARVDYEVQVVVLDAGNQVLYRTAPFGFSIERRGEALYPVAQGVPMLAERPSKLATMGLTTLKPEPVPAPLVPEGGPVSLETEARITRVLPARGGRELLLRLEGAPHWKRLSLETGAWLPLPPEPLGECRLAGNEEAIFVLVPRERRLTRYAAETLAREASLPLPERLTPWEVVAGAGSTHGPVALICQEGRYACDPVTLELPWVDVPPKDAGGWSPVAEGYDYLLSGDGRGLWGYSRQIMGGSRYFNAYAGYHQAFTPASPGSGTVSSSATVSPAIVWGTSEVRVPQPGGGSRTLSLGELPRGSDERVAWAEPLLAAPLYASLVLAQPQVPPLPGTVTLYSLLNKAPVCSLAAPELAELGRQGVSQAGRRVFFDPRSRTLVIHSQERGLKLWRLKQGDLPGEAAPVLLNFPDGVAVRGRRYTFQPEVLAPPGWTLAVAPLLPGMQVDGQGRLTWDVPHDFPPGTVDLNLKLGGTPNGRDTLYRHTVTISGPAPVLALAAPKGAAAMKEALTAMAAGAAPPPGLLTLKSWMYNSPQAVADLLPGLNDYVGLVLEDRTLVLYSTKDRRVAGSYRPSDRAIFFAAGDAVLVYEPAVSSLARLSLPGFTQEVVVTLPDHSTLLGLGVGTLPDSPVSLLLEQAPPTGLNTAARAERRLLIVEKGTLAPGRWAQLPATVPDASGQPSPGLLLWYSSQPAMQIPCSADGRVLSLMTGQVIISPGLTTGVLYAVRNETTRLPEYIVQYNPGLEASRLASSPTGDRLWNGRAMYVGTRRLEIGGSLNGGDTYSRCGNYFAQLDGSGSAAITLAAADHKRALVELREISALQLQSQHGTTGRQGRRVLPMGDRHLVVVRNATGSLVQFIECDLPAVLKAAAPETVMVTSHVPPFVAQGRTLEYRITVNHPEAVAAMRLRDSVTGGAMGALSSGTGTFTYRAPMVLKEPLSLLVGVDVILKNGTVIPHLFPLHAVPVRPPAPGRAKGADGSFISPPRVHRARRG